MDPELAQYIEEVVPLYQQSRTIGYITLATYVALVSPFPSLETTPLADDRPQIYHYATTFHEEVAQVWPQKPFKMGKVLFMTTRYSAVAAMALEINGTQ